MYYYLQSHNQNRFITFAFSLCSGFCQRKGPRTVSRWTTDQVCRSPLTCSCGAQRMTSCFSRRSSRNLSTWTPKKLFLVTKSYRAKLPSRWIQVRSTQVGGRRRNAALAHRGLLRVKIHNWSKKKYSNRKILEVTSPYTYIIAYIITFLRTILAKWINHLSRRTCRYVRSSGLQALNVKELMCVCHTVSQIQ